MSLILALYNIDMTHTVDGVDQQKNLLIITRIKMRVLESPSTERGMYTEEGQYRMVNKLLLGIGYRSSSLITSFLKEYAKASIF
jgi:hypothetical protein